jgi:hypothetical protein
VVDVFACHGRGFDQEKRQGEDEVREGRATVLAQGPQETGLAIAQRLKLAPGDSFQAVELEFTGESPMVGAA